MILLILCLLLSLPQKSEFFVLNVKGSVQVQGRATLLRKGDKLGEKDKLQFLSAGSTATVISPGKGRMDLTEVVDGRAGSKRPGELYYEVIALLKPSKKQIITAGRDAVLLDEQQFSEWLLKMTKDGNPLLVIDSLLLPVGSHFTENDKTSFFLARYTYKNELINKKIPICFPAGNRQAKLCLSKDLLNVDGKAIPVDFIEEVSWFYYDASAKTAIPLGKSSLRVISYSILEKELCVLASSQEKLTDSETMQQKIYAESYSYLKDYYGNTNMESIESVNKKIRCN